MRVDEAALSDCRRVAALSTCSRVWEGRRFASLLFILFCTHTRVIPCLRRPYVFFAFFPPLFISCFFYHIYFRLCDANRTVAFRLLSPPHRPHTTRKRTEFPVSSHAIRRVVARYLPVSTFPPTAVLI